MGVSYLLSGGKFPQELQAPQSCHPYVSDSFGDCKDLKSKSFKYLQNQVT
jgi:hypothetical protein